MKIKTHLTEIKQKIEEHHEAVKLTARTSSRSIHDWWNRRRGFDRYAECLPPPVALTCDFIEKNGLEVEGIFRISGAREEVQEIKRKLEKGKAIDLSQYTVHSVAGALKQFFIEPEESILTDELYDSFLIASGLPTEEEQIHCIEEVIEKLPVGNKLIFRRLCRLLKDVSKHSDTNKMNTHNLAIVFSPTLLRKDHLSPATLINDSEKATRLVELFIDKYDVLFADKRLTRRGSYLGPEAEAFFKTLKISAKKLAETRLLELEHSNDISVIAGHNGVDNERVTEEMVNAYYENLLKEKAQPDSKKLLKRRVSQEWLEFFSHPSKPMEIKQVETQVENS